jgi:hypothetical protein
MKRLLIAFFVFTAGASLLCGLQKTTTETRREIVSSKEAWATHTQWVARATAERADLEEQMRELKRRLAESPVPDGTRKRIAALFPHSGRTLTPEQREQLLAEFGFNWNTTDEYLVVSKQTLHSINLDTVKGSKLTGPVCDVLAITPDERAAIDTTMKQLADAYKSWATSHVKREEPSGDIVANYTMPTDAELSQSLSNRFVTEIMQTLGKERGELLEDYASDWTTALKMTGTVSNDTTMVVKRYGSDDQPRLSVELRQAGSGMTTDVSPWQPFPEAFKPLFPGGWPDLAAREGFQLPQEFKKQPKKS